MKKNSLQPNFSQISVFFENAKFCLNPDFIKTTITSFNLHSINFFDILVAPKTLKPFYDVKSKHMRYASFEIAAMSTSPQNRPRGQMPEDLGVLETKF